MPQKSVGYQARVASGCRTAPMTSFGHTGRLSHPVSASEGPGHAKSMSIIIEGSTSAGSWKGDWYFAKDRAEPRRDFSYKKTGSSIPKELLDYVSFVNPNAGDNIRALANRFRGGSGNGSGKKRGRPPNKDRNVAVKLAADATASAAAEANRSEKVGAEEKGENTNGATSVTDMEGGGNGQESAYVMKTPSAKEGSSAPNTSDSVETSPNFVEIDKTHELFGLWRGNFDVAPVEGPGNEDAHHVEETFFFHSFLGLPPKEDLSCLPAEAHYTFSALKAITVPVLPPSLVSESKLGRSPGSAGELKGEDYQPSEGEGKAEDVVKSKVKDGGEGAAPPVKEEEKNGTVVKVESIPGAAPSPAGVDSNQGTTSATPMEEEGEDPSDKDAPLQTDGSHPCGLVVLVGFGKNRFGRFSLTATLDPSKNHLIAEKRYMLSKSATLQRKGRKSDSSDVGSGPSTRPRTSSLVDVLNLSTGKKKRSNSGVNKREGYLYDDGYAYSTMSGTGRGGNKRGGGGAGSGSAGAPGTLPGVPPLELLDPPLDGEDSEYKQAIYDEVSNEVYEGSWNYGQRHGRGVCLYADGSMYEGSWSRGKEHGRGQLMSGERKVIYVGEWQDGAMHGHGTYHFYSGDKYVGDFREGTRHGKGEFQSRDGCCYVGDWRDNKRCGRGIFSWPDGSYYEGEWENDTRHGKGRLSLKSGFEYEGSWLNNSFDGRGIAVFPNGQKYEGSYKYGMREGRGSITFGEGAVYEGRFREDRLDGQGTIKVSQVVPGVESGEKLIPIEIQADIRRIHLKAGFGAAEIHH